jgi:hypothetical protein
MTEGYIALIFFDKGVQYSGLYITVQNIQPLLQNNHVYD